MKLCYLKDMKMLIKATATGYQQQGPLVYPPDPEEFRARAIAAWVV